MLQLRSRYVQQGGHLGNTRVQFKLCLAYSLRQARQLPMGQPALFMML